MAKYFLGCDVSKGYADFIILDEQKQVREAPFRLDDTAAGHRALERVLQALWHQDPHLQLFAAVESTGGLENNWLHGFELLAQRLPLKFARLNPCGVKNYMKAELTRTISDEVSARAIAGYLIAHPDKVLYEQDDPFYAARRHYSMISLLKKQKTQLSNSLHNLLYSAAPALLLYCRHGIPAWLLAVLAKYPTAAKLSRAQPAAMAKIPYVSLSRAQALIAAAQEDVASASDALTATSIQVAVEQLQSIDASILTLKDALCEQWGQHPQVQLLSSIKGMGTFSALGLLINIRSIALFPSAKHLVSYFGLHPTWRDSGDGSFGYHMSKQGRVAPREILFMVAWSATRHDEHIKKLYRKYIDEKGMKPLAALGVVMHKLVRIVYGMLTTNTAYDEAVDQKNQSRTVKTDAQQHPLKHENKIRRFLCADAHAPISRRQARKREKANESQCTISADCGIIASPSSSNIYQSTLP